MSTKVNLTKQMRVIPVQLIIEPSHGWFNLKLNDVWRFRELLYFLIWRDIKVAQRHQSKLRQRPNLGVWIEPRLPDVWHEEVGAVIRAKTLSQGRHYSDQAINSRFDWLMLNHFVDMSSGQVGLTLSNADCYFMKLGNSTVGSLDTNTP